MLKGGSEKSARKIGLGHEHNYPNSVGEIVLLSVS
jgi:hypothetical protein